MKNGAFSSFGWKFGLHLEAAWATFFTIVSCLVYSSTTKLWSTSSSERSVDLQRATLYYIPEDRTLIIRLFLFFSIYYIFTSFIVVSFLIITFLRYYFFVFLPFHTLILLFFAQQTCQKLTLRFWKLRHIHMSYSRLKFCMHSDARRCHSDLSNCVFNDIGFATVQPKIPFPDWSNRILLLCVTYRHDESILGRSC